MFEVGKADKYASVCSSCGRHIDNSEVLTEIKLCCDKNKSKATVIGRFCKGCLEELVINSIKAL